MKHSIYFACVILLTFSTIQMKAQVADKCNLSIHVKKNFLLLPVQENKSEATFTIVYPDGKESPKYWIRLAENSIDYWVKLDVGKQKGKTISLDFEKVKEKEFGLKHLKQSNQFPLNFFEKYRPLYHFTPQYGWMNDPNGMVYSNGEYHLFYQYNPFGCVWGNMSWGHAVSKNLVDWTYLPVALSPDSLGAVFSGSAVIDRQNTAGFGKDAMIAVYTSAGEVQTQSIAYSTDNGRTFSKYSENPVIKNPGIVDFRDPKVFWYAPTSQWILSLATKQSITFYGSKNLKDWTRLSEFGEGLGCHDGVWECPDLFYLPIDGENKGAWVLIVNINPGAPNGGSGTQYFIGNFDGKTFTADQLPYPLWVDYGKDNYAGVTWNNIPESDGRRIFLGWMNNWEYANQTPTKYFRSSNTVPRELKLKNNGQHLVLANYPVAEILSIFKKSSQKEAIEVSREYLLTNLLKNNDGTYKIEMTIERKNAEKFGFSLQNARNEELNFTFNTGTKTLLIDRNKSGNTNFSTKFVGISTAPLAAKESYAITLLIDKSSAELFVDGGALAMTTLFFPTEPMNGLKFFSSDNMIVKNMNIAKKE